MIPFSPGVLVGSLELLRLARLTPLALREIPVSFSRLGSVPTRDVLAVTQGLNWIEADPAGMVELTPAGQRLAALDHYQLQARAALLDYIEVVRPAWLQMAAQGRLRVRAFAGGAIAQVMDEAGLMSGEDPATVAFWDALAAQARGLRNDRLTEIGRVGERLTMSYERDRTTVDPKWVALDNNADGYDVLSVVSDSDLSALSIEVKTTTMQSGGAFHVTANEWQRAVEAEAHLFYLWRLNASREAGQLSVVTVEGLAAHVPQNQGLGTWESVEVPFSAFV